jgi:hypothetical protein
LREAGVLIVSKDDFKFYQREGGGTRGALFLGVAKYFSGPYDIIPNTTGTFNVLRNGIFFDILFGAKAFISVESIQQVDIRGNLVMITATFDGAQNSITFRIDKDKDVLKFEEAIIGIKGWMSSVNPGLQHPVQEEQVFCPKCASPQLSVRKKSVGVGVRTGGASIGASGLMEIQLTCLTCGFQFNLEM